MKKYFCFFSLLLCCFLAGCAKPDGEAKNNTFVETPSSQKESDTAGTDTSTQAENETDTDGQVTIWLDADNNYLNRYVAASYQYAREHYGTGDLEQYYPEISWNIVDKSYLTPEQYRAELLEALEAGDGPDLIFMDTYNGISPEDMMDGGYLAEITQYAAWYGEDIPYAAGTLEAGRRDEKQYAVPVSIQCPVLFGMAADLEEAGIDAENGCGTLKEFLEALLAAHEKTGKQILENAQAVDWLEQYYADAQDEETLILLEQVRTYCGTDDGVFAAYDALNSGEALLGGCGVMDGRQMGMNLALFSEEQEPEFLYVPAGNGTKRAVITQSVGINAESEHIEELDTALHMYWHLLVAEIAPLSPVADGDYEVFGIEPYMQDQLYWSFERKYAQQAAYSLPDAVKKDFIDTVYGGVQEAVYAVPSAGGMVPAKVEKAGEKKVITVLYADSGLGNGYPLTGWLEQAAADFHTKNEGYYVQLLKIGKNPLFYASLYSEFYESGTEPDIVLLPHAVFENKNVIDTGRTADAAGFLEERAGEAGFLPEYLKSGSVRGDGVGGLPYAADTYGIWCNKETLKKAGLPEDWKPENLEKLNDGLRLLKETEGVETGAAWECSINNLKAVFAFLDPETAGSYFIQETDGTGRLSREAWESFIKMLVQMRDDGTVAPTGLRNSALTQEQAAQGLIDGTVGAVIDNGTFGGWYDSAHGLELTGEQREKLVFVPLSPLAEVHVFSISKNSRYPEMAMEFWLQALQSEAYEEAVSAAGMTALGELPEQVRGILPYARAVNSAGDLWNGIWLLEKTAEELETAEYSIYEWME